MDNTGRMETEKDVRPVGLQRSVGFYGLMMVSLGSIIGSGWLLGALNAAERAGPASVLSWILAAGMLSLLALVYAELGATYPVAGGSGRFPYYSHGPIAGFMAGWASWLQAVFIAPIEVLAAITYVNSVGWVSEHSPLIHATGESMGLLNGTGLVVAIALMMLFTAVNLLGAKFLSDSNAIINVWKLAVPVLAVFVVARVSFHPSNFHAGGGFMPSGFHGVFAPAKTSPEIISRLANASRAVMAEKAFQTLLSRVGIGATGYRTRLTLSVEAEYAGHSPA
jgi:amino acid transporter